MRGLLPLSLVFAVTATVGLAWLVLRTPEGGPEQDVSAEERPEYASPAPEAADAGPLRRYQTTSTLVEDLRDALAEPETGQLPGEFARVSRAIMSKAGWTLSNLAPEESSPRVRALLVLAAGRHLPDADVLLAFLDDRSAAVRTAAVVATGYAEDRRRLVELVGGLALPVGRDLPAATRTRLEQRRERERDEGVRAALDAVLSPARR